MKKKGRTYSFLPGIYASPGDFSTAALRFPAGFPIFAD